jgi:hypothetical protein
MMVLTHAMLPRSTQGSVCFLIGVFFILLSTGCATSIDPAGNLAETQTVPQVISQIKIGVTKKDDLIRMLGEPSSQSATAAGYETLIFAEKVPFWETGTTSLLMGRQKVRVFYVTLQNGVVTDYYTSESWAKRK